MLIRSAIAIVALLVLWVIIGRQLTLLIDRMVTIRLDTLPTSPVIVNRDRLEIGGKLGTLLLTEAPFEIRIGPGPDHPFILGQGPDAVTLGTAVPRPDPDGGEFYEIKPAEGSKIEYVVDRSVLSWPTPFQFNFMTGHSPGRKRYLYHRFSWTKPTGGRVEALWRYEQWHYDIGWSGLGGMVANESTGLLRSKVVPDSTG